MTTRAFLRSLWDWHTLADWAALALILFICHLYGVSVWLQVPIVTIGGFAVMIALRIAEMLLEEWRRF